ncbi:MAG: lamin tail domain-containing protein [Gammaproteobacteria bacterium]|nr:lamin tail domain-containing protein [Gammaproteobacteria bacterium]
MKISNAQAFAQLCNQYLFIILTTALLITPNISHSITISDLYISEIMANPEAVSDSNGEWFELYNPGSELFSFNDIVLSDNDSNHHLISASDALIIQPGSYFVFGNNGDSSSNGGYSADYIYSNFVLANSSDEIILTDTQGNSLQLAYESGFIPSGHSMALTSAAMTIANYDITTDFNYGVGDFGTPGTNGSSQLAPAAVPEPSSLILLLSGLLVAGYQARKNAKP